MLNVLINAYAISPNWGSEQGVGWHWMIEIAKHCRVFVITEGQWREEIEEAIQTLPQKENIRMYYNPVSERVRRMCWNQGDWRFYFYYHFWQKKALKIARRICAEHRIDIIHQLNMIGFREPGLLWKIDGVKHVWGPVGNMGVVPMGFLRTMPLKDCVFYMIKNTISVIQRRIPPVSCAVRRNDLILSSIENTSDCLRKIYSKQSILMPETGLTPISNNIHIFPYDRKLELLWVGRLLPSKMLNLALESIANSRHHTECILHIVGIEETPVVQSKHSLVNCVWHGKVSHDEVLSMMEKVDALFFTSIFEGTPHVVLESISMNLPVLCFNTCGQGLIVNDSVGWKVEVKNYKSAVIDFSAIIDLILENRSVIEEKSRACLSRQEELTWEEKIHHVLELYSECLKQE